MKSMISFRLDSESIVFFFNVSLCSKATFPGVYYHSTTPNKNLYFLHDFLNSLYIGALGCFHFFSIYCFFLKRSSNKRKDTPTKQRKKQNKTRKIDQEQIPGLLFAHGYAETRGFHLSDESPTHATTTFTANRRVPNGPEV